MSIHSNWILNRGMFLFVCLFVCFFICFYILFFGTLVADYSKAELCIRQTWKYTIINKSRPGLNKLQNSQNWCVRITDIIRIYLYIDLWLEFQKQMKNTGQWLKEWITLVLSNKCSRWAIRSIYMLVINICHVYFYLSVFIHQWKWQ